MFYKFTMITSMFLFISHLSASAIIPSEGASCLAIEKAYKLNDNSYIVKFDNAYSTGYNDCSHPLNSQMILLKNTNNIDHLDIHMLTWDYSTDDPWYLTGADPFPATWRLIMDSKATNDTLKIIELSDHNAVLVNEGKATYPLILLSDKQKDKLLTKILNQPVEIHHQPVFYEPFSFYLTSTNQYILIDRETIHGFEKVFIGDATKFEEIPIKTFSQSKCGHLKIEFINGNMIDTYTPLLNCEDASQSKYLYNIKQLDGTMDSVEMVELPLEKIAEMANELGIDMDNYTPKYNSVLELAELE